MLSSRLPPNATGRHISDLLTTQDGVDLINDLSVPTHIRGGRLDLTFVSSSLLSRSQWALHPHLTSDHFAVTVLLDTSIPSPPPLPPRFRMQDADWPHFRALTETSLRASELSLSLDEEACYITSSILSAAQASIPLRKTTTHHRFRDHWIYGPRVREVNRRLNAAR